MDGVVGRVEAAALVDAALALVGHGDEAGGEPRAGMDRARAEMRLRRMRGEAGDRGEEGADALVGVGQLERGRLADDDGARGRGRLLPIAAMPSTTPRQVTSSS